MKSSRHFFGSALALTALAFITLSPSTTNASVKSLAVLEEEAEAIELFNLKEACTKTTRRSNVCLKGYLAYKCMVYGSFYLPYSPKSERCVKAVDRLVELLDVKQVLGGTLEELKNAPNADSNTKSGLILQQVLFTRRLDAIFEDPRTATRMGMLEEAASRAYELNVPANLWKVVKSFTSSTDEALDFMGVALQDASNGTTQLSYLWMEYQRRGLKEDSVQMRNFMAAASLMTLLKLNKLDFAETGGDPLSGFTLYPMRQEGAMHPFWHHFYIPALTARKLLQAGVKPEEAFFASFLLNTTYEFTYMDTILGTSNWPFRDPGSFDLKKVSREMKKIYTGYAGAMFAIGRNDIQPYSQFAAEFSKDPSAKMKALFRTDFSKN